MERRICVTGKGKISVAPDLIRLNITADGVYKTYEETLKKSAEETGVLRKTLEKAGLDPKDLKTTSFDVKNIDFCAGCIDCSVGGFGVCFGKNDSIGKTRSILSIGTDTR